MVISRVVHRRTDAEKIDTKPGQWQGVARRLRQLVAGVALRPGSARRSARSRASARRSIDWLAYGHAARTEKGAQETFGKGDVRGVIASESSNNAKEGGALVPTIAFGVPGSASHGDPARRVPDPRPGTRVRTC